MSMESISSVPIAESASVEGSGRMSTTLSSALGAQLHAVIVREEDDTISTWALNLPGAASCGATESEALNGLRDAVKELIATYLADGAAVPWVEEHNEDADAVPDGSKVQWIVANG